MLVRRALTPLLLLALAYVAAPYVAVWRLSAAVQHGDASALRRMIDWTSVRSGLKQDIAEGLVGVHQSAGPAAVGTRGAADTLPPFGASFMAGIAGSVIDHEVTPEHLVATLRQLQPAEPDAVHLSVPDLRHAFFDSPTSFVIEILCPGQDSADQPLRLRLAISHGAWKVVRAWIPQDLIDEANART